MLDRDGGDPRAVVRDQPASTGTSSSARPARAAARLLDALERADGAAPELFLHAIEGMTMAEYYTPEQLARSRSAGARSATRGCAAPNRRADLIAEA